MALPTSVAVGLEEGVEVNAVYPSACAPYVRHLLKLFGPTEVFVVHDAIVGLGLVASSVDVGEDEHIEVGEVDDVTYGGVG